MRQSIWRLEIVMIILLFLFSKLSAEEQTNSPKLTEPNSFSMILLPDPQTYIKFDKNQPLFELMTSWIASNIETLSIKAVLCTGDLVEQNEYLIPHGVNGNQTSRQQWEFSSRAFKRLDNKVPYIIAPGNHDYGYEKAEKRMSNMSNYFKVERNVCWKKHLVSICNNGDGLPALENAAYEFDGGNWGKLLIIAIEFAPRDEVLEWALQLSSEERFNNHRVFVITHSFLQWNGSRITTEKYKIFPANYGEAIWEKLLYPASNIRLLICGHRCNLGGFEQNVGFREDRNSANKTVSQMLFNAQTAGGGYHGNGGDGWLRILEFLPDGKTLKVKTYSPLFGISPTTERFAWRRENFDEFDIIIDK